MTDIDWAALEHAYGDGSNLPAWIERLRDDDPDVRAEAVVYLRQSVYHQCGGYSAAPLVAPLLIEALGDPRVDRAGVLHLLELLTEGYRLPRGLSPRLDEWTDYERYFGPAEIEIFARSYEVIRGGADVYLELIGDPDLDVACAAARLISGYPTLAARAAAPVLAAFDRAVDWDSRMALCLAAAMLARVGELPPPDAVIAALRGSTDRIERQVGTLARLWARQPLDDCDLAALADALGPRAWDSEMIFGWGSTVAALIAYALYAGRAHGDLLERAILEAAGGWPDRGNHSYPAEALHAARALAADPEALLAAVCDRMTEADLRAFLGRDFYDRVGRAPVPAPADELERTERLVGAGELAVEDALAAFDPTEGLEERAAAFAERGPYNGVNVVGERAVALLYAAMLVRAGDPPDLVEEILTSIDLVVSFADPGPLHREVIAALPPDRRGPLIDELSIYSHQEPSEAWALYDLAPSTQRAALLIELMPEWPDFFAGPAAFRAVEILAAHLEVAVDQIVSAVADPGFSHRHVAAAALAHGSAGNLDPFANDADPRVAALARTTGPPTRELLRSVGISPAVRRPRPRGGVIGRDGKLWDGEPWR